MISQSATPKLNPHVSVDCVLFGFDFEELKVLLIERKEDAPSGHGLTLPGDLIYDDEDLDTAAGRVLHELTGLSDVYLEQFATFGDPNRVRNPNDMDWLSTMREQPNARVITVAYYSLVQLNDYNPQGSSFAERADWVPVSQIPQLGFDHNQIIEGALKRLKEKLRYYPVGFELLPEKFTLGQLQKLYEAILGRELDKRNFRRKVLNMGFLTPLAEKQKKVSHKPAQLFQFNPDFSENAHSSGF